MRRDEITPELIELSKKAKSLGFPQDTEDGDWISTNNPVTKEPFDYPELVTSGRVFTIGDMLYIIDDDEQFNLKGDSWQLVLSFSRCLEWLDKHCDDFYIHRFGLNSSVLEWEIEIDYSHNKPSLLEGSKTPHETMTKVVVKILEGE